MNSDSSISKSENKNRNANKSWRSGILFLLLLFFIILGAACCHFFPWFTSTITDNPPQEVKVADIETATIYLETLSRRAIYFSVQHGGNGKTNFPANIGDIYSAIPTKLKKAIISDFCHPKLMTGILFVIHPIRSNSRHPIRSNSRHPIQSSPHPIRSGRLNPIRTM